MLLWCSCLEPVISWEKRGFLESIHTGAPSTCLNEWCQSRQFSNEPHTSDSPEPLSQWFRTRRVTSTCLTWNIKLQETEKTTKRAWGGPGLWFLKKSQHTWVMPEVRRGDTDDCQIMLKVHTKQRKWWGRAPKLRRQQYPQSKSGGRYKWPVRSLLSGWEHLEECSQRAPYLMALGAN